MQVLSTIPFHAPNLLFINISESEKTELLSVLAQQPGVEGPPAFLPTAWLALSRAGNETLGTLRAARPRTWIQKSWPASCMDSRPESVEVVAGQWWNHASAENALALDEQVAGLFGVTVGSTVEFVVAGRPLRARVAALVHIPPARRVWWHEIIFGCGALPGAVYSGAVTVRPNQLAQVQRTLRERLPGVRFIEVNGLLERAERLGMGAARVLRVVALTVVCMAALLLLAVIHSVRAFRVYEIAVLRAIGARRRTLLAVIAVEHLALGVLAGLTGAVLGFSATALILHHVAGKFVWTFDPAGVTVSIAGAAAMAVGVSVVSSITLFRQKPFEILRR
jgi:putative ABC transport system permease protein